MNIAFVLRLTWDRAAQGWRIVLAPANGDDPLLFGDPESFFLYIEQVMMDQSERDPEDLKSSALSQQSTQRH